MEEFICLLCAIAIIILSFNIENLMGKLIMISIGLLIMYFMSVEVLATFNIGEKKSYSMDLKVVEKYVSKGRGATHYSVVCVDRDGNMVTFGEYDAFYSVLVGKRYARRWDDYKVLGRTSCDKNIKWIRR